MTDKNIKKTQNNTALPREDVQLYRLFAIFGAAIIGFAGLRLLNESKLLSFLLQGGIWGALVLLILSIAWPIYIRCVRKIDESGKVFTSVGVAYFLIPVFLMLVTYPVFNNANVKYQVAFAGISTLSPLSQIDLTSPPPAPTAVPSAVPLPSSPPESALITSPAVAPAAEPTARSFP